MSRRDRMGTRERTLSAAMRLIRCQGVAATGVVEVLAEAHAPKGTLYHHFPGGKSQLVAEALQLNADQVTDALHDVIGATPDASTALTRYADDLARDLEGSEFQAGCPLATAVLEQAATDDAVAEIGDRAFDTWRRVIGEELRQGRVDGADDLALLCVAALEGALVLARANRDTAPLLRIAQILGSIIERATE